jgi:hypothetical protein
VIVYSVDPEVPFSDDPPYIETGGLAGMMTPQGLQIASPEDSLPRLRIVTDGIVIVNVVFRVDITGRRRETDGLHVAQFVEHFQNFLDAPDLNLLRT